MTKPKYQKAVTAVVPTRSPTVDQIGKPMLRDIIPQRSPPSAGKCGCGGAHGAAPRNMRSSAVRATPLPLRSAATHTELARTGLRSISPCNLHTGLDAPPLSRACEEDLLPIGRHIPNDVPRTLDAPVIPVRYTLPPRYLPPLIVGGGGSRLCTRWQTTNYRLERSATRSYQLLGTLDLARARTLTTIGSPPGWGSVAGVWGAVGIAATDRWIADFHRRFVEFWREELLRPEHAEALVEADSLAGSWPGFDLARCFINASEVDGIVFASEYECLERASVPPDYPLPEPPPSNVTSYFCSHEAPGRHEAWPSVRRRIPGYNNANLLRDPFVCAYQDIRCMRWS